MPIVTSKGREARGELEVDQIVGDAREKLLH